MDVATTQRNSDEAEKHNRSDDGDTPMPDATTEMGGTTSSFSPSVSASSSGLPSAMDQDREENHGGNKDRETTKLACDWKDEGNKRFGKEDWGGALHSYRSGLAVLLRQREATEETRHESNHNDAPLAGRPVSEGSLEIALRSNMAFALLKLHEYDRAEEECNELLSIAPQNSKALYRRACAREGFYFSCNMGKKADNQSHGQSSSEQCQSKMGMGRKKELLSGAISDLQQALLCLEKENHEQRQSSSENGNSSGGRGKSGSKRKSNKGVIQQCQRSLDRLQKEFNRQEKQQWNSEGAMRLTRNENQNKNTKSALPKQKRLQSEQKQDIKRLLVARYQSGRVLQGEAFFLLEWNWWVRWCRYVDFFDFASASRKKKDSTADSTGDNSVEHKRRRLLLTYMPPGASFPLQFRKRFGNGDDDDDSSDDEEDENDSIIMTPGPIDNSELIVPTNDSFFEQWYLPAPISHESVDGDNPKISASPSLKPNLIRGYHYEIVPREVYNALRSWYGEKTPSLCRRITKDGNLALYLSTSLLKSSRLTIACRSTPRCNACRAPGANSRCKQCLMVQYCDRACQESHWRFHRQHCNSMRRIATNTENNESIKLVQIPFPSDGGRVGLNNLGNTCFMNSALQSLSHATPLTRHFLSNRFKSDLNTSNPLGTGGKLALAYETFLKDAWMKQGTNSISPTALKRAIALFAPRFAGCHQHDAQEFLAYLLDGLHEDLNRIRRAPYVEMPDVTDGQNMTIAAAEAWSSHKRRNDSLVMDTFYGQFQSTCVCPKCKRISVSFDAFNHVSLEIPSSDAGFATMAVPVLVHFADGKRKPVRFGVTLRRQSCILDLRTAVADLAQIPTDKLIMTDVYENSIYKLLDEKQSLSTINPNEDNIVAYEVTPYAVKDTLHMIVTHSLLENKINQTRSDAEEGRDKGNVANGDTPEHKHIGLPFMTSIDAKNSSCHDLWQLICGFVRRLVADIGDKNAKDSRLEDVLTIHIVDAAGRSRKIFKTNSDKEATSILPILSKTLLSTFLGEDCAERFLFLNLVWKSQTTPNEKNSIIDPNKFLEVENHPTLVEAIRQQRSLNNSTTRKGVTLDQCFQSFSRPERLDTNNMWYCSKCKEHVQALKTMKLWRLPNILVVHLKRFEFKHALRRDKLNTFVDFPLAGLDMNPHCARRQTTEGNKDFANSNVPADYDLFAVVNHYGRLGFGHYTAFAMQWDETGISKEWNAFDDSSVHPIQPSDVHSSAAYILFYRRRIFH